MSVNCQVCNEVCHKGHWTAARSPITGEGVVVCSPCMGRTILWAARQALLAEQNPPCVVIPAPAPDEHQRIAAVAESLKSRRCAIVVTVKAHAAMIDEAIDCLREGVPLRVAEAREVADQIRRSTGVDQQYWPWVIEQLCNQLEAARQ